MSKWLIFFAGIGLVTVGCSSVARLPSTTGQAPIGGGGFLSGRVGLDLANAIPVKTVDDITTNPPTRTTIGVGHDDLFDDVFFTNTFAGTGFDAGLGLLKRLDVYYTRNPGLRFLAIGDPEGEGWKTSVFVGYFSTDQDETFNISNVKTKLTGLEYGVSIGKQFKKSALAYLTLASRGGDAEITIVQTGIGQFQYDDEYDHYIASLGIILGDKVYFKAEVSGNYIDWQGTNPNTLQEISDSGFEFGGTLGAGFAW